jgi:hypothetical protein
MLSNIEHPSHYRKNSGYEAIDVIDAWNLGFSLGNAVKYICRAGIKDKNRVIEDLRKAVWYIEYEISKLEKEVAKDSVRP